LKAVEVTEDPLAPEHKDHHPSILGKIGSFFHSSAPTYEPETEVETEHHHHHSSKKHEEKHIIHKQNIGGLQNHLQHLKDHAAAEADSDDFHQFLDHSHGHKIGGFYCFLFGIFIFEYFWCRCCLVVMFLFDAASEKYFMSLMMCFFPPFFSSSSW
jgi:hypothetical protein